MVETSNTWIQLSDGSMFDYEAVLNYPESYKRTSAEMLPIVASALSKVCRYTGHTKEFYSVAQHAVICSRLADPAIAYECLHHDDAEIVMSDMNTILKGVVNRRTVDAWKGIELPIEAWFADVFGCNNWRAPGVKTVDLLALSCERKVFMGPSAQHWDFFDDPARNYAMIDVSMILKAFKEKDFSETVDGTWLNYSLFEAWPSKMAEKIYIREHNRLAEPPF